MHALANHHKRASFRGSPNQHQSDGQRGIGWHSFHWPAPTEKLERGGWWSASTARHALGQPKHGVSNDIRFVKGPNAKPVSHGFIANREYVHVLELLVFGIIDAQFTTKPIYIGSVSSEKLPSGLHLEFLAICL